MSADLGTPVVHVRAFLVVGPESSGTRLMTRILLNAGCMGSDDHDQTFDKDLPLAADHSHPIVWRRSYPHRTQWHTIIEMVERLAEAGYTHRHVLVMTRAHYCLVQSQLAAPHVTSASEARSNITVAYRRIFSQILSVEVPFTVVPYESLVLHPLAAQRHLCNRLGLTLQSPVYIRDENAKWGPPTLAPGAGPW